jgi:hypothetical protein
MQTLVNFKSFKDFKGHNMFRPTWASSGVKIYTYLIFKVNKCFHVRLKSDRDKYIV